MSFHFESGFGGHTSQMSTPIGASSSPLASPIFSP
jgi:hypothetical protein